MKNLFRSIWSRIRTPAREFTRASAGNLESDKWSASDTVLRLQHVVGKRPYPLDELLLMTAAFQYLQPAVVVEIGTHARKSARIWWELSRMSVRRTAIHTIDLHDPSHVEYPGKTLGRMIKGPAVVQHYGDGFEVADRLLPTFARSDCWLFLDGDHAYETVAKELTLVSRHPNVVGVLVHDTFYQPGSEYNHGPYEAVTAFVAAHPVLEVVHAHIGLPGMTYIRV
jgi:hypothetical protein